MEEGGRALVRLGGVAADEASATDCKKIAGEPVSRIWFLALQTHNLSRINERFSFRDLWRRVFLTQVKTSDMFLTCLFSSRRRLRMLISSHPLTE
jgi:hypothetical protein